MHSSGSNTKENEDVYNQKLVIASEKHIVKNRAGRNQMDILCNEQEDGRNQKREERHEEGRDERLKDFTLVWITIKVLFL